MSVVSLALLSIFSEILSNLARGFAHLPWHLYLSVVLGVFRSIQGPMCRTIVSNIVPASDTGKENVHKLANFFKINIFSR